MIVILSICVQVCMCFGGVLHRCLPAGLSDLMSEVVQDFSSKPICSLCSVNEDSTAIEFKCFLQARPLHIRRVPLFYSLFSGNHHSDLFQKIWKSKLDEVLRTKVKLTFEEVATKVWDPVFEECSELVDSVRGRTLKLKKVDSYFLQLKVGSVSQNLKDLYTAVEACRNKTEENSGWIQRSVDLMEQYWALCKQVKAANIVLELRDKLKLAGDFEIFQDVASRVNTSMMDAPLESIGRKTLKDAKSFLDKATEEEKKLECLEQFTACLSIVEWMRKETKG